MRHTIVELFYTRNYKRPFAVKLIIIRENGYRLSALNTRHQVWSNRCLFSRIVRKYYTIRPTRVKLSRLYCEMNISFISSNIVGHPILKRIVGQPIILSKMANFPQNPLRSIVHGNVNTTFLCKLILYILSACVHIYCAVDLENCSPNNAEAITRLDAQSALLRLSNVIYRQFFLLYTFVLQNV